MKNTKIKIINEIYNLILDETITDFEREKLLIAKELLEGSKDNNYFAILRRIQITFVAKSIQGENSQKFSDFYSKLSDLIAVEMRNQATSTPLGGVPAIPQPL
ncbi:bacteriocin immunity protein [Lactococcus petauri]|uniref:bacteriocin immunity protein n=1 Tax=Lactococcus petauri TaxID=1940789 RepID=UPI00254E613F|nr:bacteriocin immunity protein [Lactococcus petauri]